MRTVSLVAFLFFASIGRADSPAPVKSAIEKALSRIDRGSNNYTKQRNCFSCHHQALPIMSMSSARKRGFAISADTIKKQVEFSLKTFRKKELVEKGQGIGGSNTTVLYALTTLAAVDYPPDDITDSMVRFLLVRQGRDGSWPAVAKRPPSEGSAFTNTALAMFVLPKYGLGKFKEAGMVKTALARGKEWLLDNEPLTTEDKIFRLRGLVHAGVNKREIAAARDLLLKEQKADGSWSQVPGKPGDAYAAGSALISLRIAGLKTDDLVYSKGVKFLLGSQNKDGSWVVPTRSRPIQTFFDNGDAGGKSQFISMTATSWANLALLETLPVLTIKPGSP
jgi:N-acyl-D-amino-acid deacylase